VPPQMGVCFFRIEVDELTQVKFIRKSVFSIQKIIIF